MIVYREQRHRIPTAEAVCRVECARGDERLIAAGELEAGLVDALCPEFDDIVDPAGAPLPETIEISVSEGFAYYGLDPELYRRSARRFLRECRPGAVAVIGIRSIGATLSTVVQTELRRLGCATARWTVRPRGHPWDRELRVSPALERAWRECPGWFAVVDEGPGLSGSSFASVTGFLAGLGVPESRIVLFPSWDSDGSDFVSPTARERWQRHRRFVTEFEELGLFPGARDLSGGQWRDLLPPGCRPVVQPQHERRKYLRDGHLFKFAGYGRYGRAQFERAQALAPFIPHTFHFDGGFLESEWIAGVTPAVTDEFLSHVALYLAFVRREFATGQAPDFDALAEMIAVNSPESADPSIYRAAVESGEAVHLDARMLPHEWLQTARGYIKTDALEHHDDHFFPGPQDTAWDLAAFATEFHLDHCAEHRLIERYRRESGDRDVEARLPFYRLAYLAFRLGYATLAAQTLAGCEDGAAFEQLAGALHGS